MNKTNIVLFVYIYDLDQPGHLSDNILSRPLLSTHWIPRDFNFSGGHQQLRSHLVYAKDDLSFDWRPHDFEYGSLFFYCIACNAHIIRKRAMDYGVR